MNALGIDISLANPTYTQTTFTEEEILDNHSSVLCSFDISTKDGELNIPALYWIHKFLKCPYSAILLGLPNAPQNLYPNY
jgi:hypothetical protein